ncbi:helix-turn-helix transcriptional regulator [Sporosarcina sp. E16_3]|uniref:helix-turn-helix domain-containing protein n=1 Tax=Sporosarcina sp. E16_3 TaxID=2789293 RepID=UPI001A923D5D|nr:helix-turn-helix transcriptional regulator [Sporosarcina sp. E16_3]
MNKFGTRIRKLREEKKLTLRSLAEQSNLSYSFIASLEKGRYNPSRESIFSLANPLDADVNELLMLAGFLPKQHETVEQQVENYSGNHLKCNEQFVLENIMDMSVTFQGVELKKADKIALIAFLVTVSGLKESE